jgi:hypothetical protein
MIRGNVGVAFKVVKLIKYSAACNISSGRKDAIPSQKAPFTTIRFQVEDRAISCTRKRFLKDFKNLRLESDASHSYNIYTSNLLVFEHIRSDTTGFRLANLRHYQNHKAKHTINMSLTRAFFLHSVLSYCVLAVTVIPLTLNLPKPYESAVAPASSDSDLLLKLHTGAPLDNTVYLSSHSFPQNLIETSGMYASHDSFVHGAIDAGAEHQHLVIQPQDVWLTMLKQVSSYLRRHKDDKEVSEKWDNLEGKSTPPMVDMFFSSMDSWMEHQFNLRSKTNWLLDWVRPNFDTVHKPDIGSMQNSTEDMIANALMMSSSSISLDVLAPFPCENGIPSITLLGTKTDWKNLLGKLDSLEQLGKEPKLYSHMLRPILSRFVATFDKPNDLSIRLFWSDIVTATPRQKLCRTTDLITGWINVFHYWDGAGSLVPNAQVQVSSNEAVQLDGITYPWRHRKDLPTSYSHVPMCLSGGTPGWSSAEVLVGMLAKSVKKGIPEGYVGAMKLAGFTLPTTVVESDHSILQPVPIWIVHANSKVLSTPLYLHPGRCRKVS